MCHTKKKSRGWLTLELLLTVTLTVLVMSAGSVTMFQIMGVSNGLFPTNQLQQVELSRLMLEIEKDFSSASRAYVYNSCLTEGFTGGNPLSFPLTHIYVGINVINHGGDCNIWNTSITPVNDGAFLFLWGENNAAITGNGSILGQPSVANSVQYYTLVLLGGTSSAPGVSYEVPTINAVVYLTDMLTTQNGVSGMKYTLTRYENNGSQLIAGQTFSYFAPGASFTASDQSTITTTFPSITRNGSKNSIVFRFPTAFSTALKDIQTGNQARRVKKTADVWGAVGTSANSFFWTFAPENGSTGQTAPATIGKWY
jgi:hypothetical protein